MYPEVVHSASLVTKGSKETASETGVKPADAASVLPR